MGLIGYQGTQAMNKEYITYITRNWTILSN